MKTLFFLSQLLVIRIAFIYHDDSHIKAIHFLPALVEPSYRVAINVYPKINNMKITLAMSRSNQDGTITPIFIVDPTLLKK